jgi:hypothetical protein
MRRRHSDKEGEQEVEIHQVAQKPSREIGEGQDCKGRQGRFQAEAAGQSDGVHLVELRQNQVRVLIAA